MAKNKVSSNKETGSVVKIDSSLLMQIQEIINNEENRFRFVNKKQFIDQAVNEFIKNLEKEGMKK
jgi:hypothetical protein